MTIKLRGKIYHYEFKIRGITYRGSLFTSDKQKAKVAERLKWTEIYAQTDDNPKPLVPTIAVLRDLDVARAKREGREEITIEKGIKLYYKPLIAFFKDANSINKDSVARYVDHRRASGLRRQSISTELACLKRGLRLADIHTSFYWPKLARDKPDPKRASKHQPVERLRAWLALLEGEAHDLALFAILTGLRSAELYRVQPEDIDGRVLQVKEKVKRRNQRRVWLCDTIMDILPRLPFKSEHKKAMMSASKATGTTNITLRDLRAAFATAGDNCGDSRAVDMAIGHSGIPARYQKSDLDRLRKVSEAVETWLNLSQGTHSAV